MDTNRSATDLYPIDDQVIGICTKTFHGLMITIQHTFDVVCFWRREWMMHRMETLCLFIPFK